MFRTLETLWRRFRKLLKHFIDIFIWAFLFRSVACRLSRTAEHRNIQINNNKSVIMIFFKFHSSSFLHWFLLSWVKICSWKLCEWMRDAIIFFYFHSFFLLARWFAPVNQESIQKTTSTKVGHHDWSNIPTNV